MNNIIPMPIDGMRQAPSNLDAERGLLGTIIARNGAMDSVAEFLKPEHFHDSANAAVYEKLCELIGAGQRADGVALKALADVTGPVQFAGGMKYIASLMGAAVTYINAAEYGRIIHDAFLRRELIEIAKAATFEAFDSEDRAGLQIEALEERLFALSSVTSSQARVTDLAGAVAAAVRQAEIAYKADGALMGVTTGVRDLDRKLGGLHKSDLVILAGRPSMGKSGLAAVVGFSAAKAGKHVALFSLEMSAEQFATRIVSHITGLDSHDIRNGRVSPVGFQKLHAAQEQLAGLPLHVDDSARPSLAAIRTACRRLKRREGLDLIIIDYLQLIDPPRSDNRVQEVSQITMGLKAIAKDMNVPVLALSQLSRALENREDKHPQLSDLRESGTIEQDADVVMFVYREEYYVTRNGGVCPPHLENVAEVNIAKQRHGPIGGIKCHFDHKSAWFSDLAGDYGRA
jgi:replicative DNA helicase